MNFPKYILIILIISVIPLIDLFHPGLPITHDGQDHIARIVNFYQNLSEGNIIPRWAGNLNWGYGTPILMFLYPLPSYAASLFHFLGFNFVDSVKLVFGISFILSGLFMYIWLKEFLQKDGSLVGAFLYMFAPYRFVDLYVRGDIGEHVAFLFIPLTLYFLLKISKDSSILNLIGGSVSFAFLILSHNAISLMFLPIIFLYAFYLISTSSYKQYLIFNILSLIFLGFGLSAFFWIPGFFEGKYTLRDIVTAGEFASRFPNFKDFVWGAWSYGISGQFTVQIGILHWIFVFLGIFGLLKFFKEKNKQLPLLFSSLLIFFFTLFLMSIASKFIWDNISLLQKFQFPWRFLAVNVFCSALIGAIVFSQIKRENYRKLLAVIFIVFVLFLNKNYWHAKGYLQKPESFYTGIYNSTTDTGESSPRWSVRFMEHRFDVPMKAVEGTANVKVIERTFTKHIYEVNAPHSARILENTLYFPGWEIFVDGRKQYLQFQDPNFRGLMTFYLHSGKHIITVEFVETLLRKFSDLISLGSFIILTAMFLKYKFK